jgi:two-component sensor histidine kinase/integral membrane sensor domain MASE1
MKTPARSRAFIWTRGEGIWILLLAAAYAAAAALGLRWAIVPGAGTAVWPAAGIALAALAMGGARLWPGVFVGRMAAALIVASPQPVWGDLIIAAGTTLGAVAPVLVMRRLDLRPDMGRMAAMLWLVLAGAGLGATISAGGGVVALALSGVGGHPLLHAGWTWWFGYTAGVLAVAPLLFNITTPREPLGLRGGLHLGAALAANLILGAYIFLGFGAIVLRAWLVIPALVWAALAFGNLGASLGTAAIALLAIISCLVGTGPFTEWGAADLRLLVTQEFVTVIGATILILATVATERGREERLRRSQAQLQAETSALELLTATGVAISSELDVDAVAQKVIDAGRLLTGAASGAFFYSVDEGEPASTRRFATSGMAAPPLQYPRPTALLGEAFTGTSVVRLADVMADARYGKAAPFHGMPEGHPQVRSYLAVPVRSRSGEVLGSMFFGHPEVGVFDERAERLAGGLAGQAASAIDNARLYQAARRELAERRRAEEHQRLLINELNHRVKNTLATVQSIGAQTLRSASDVQGARAAFEARLMALSRAHDLLTRERWEGACLGDVVAAAIGAFEASRFVTSGPNLQLEPSAALAISMALHELATNAVKYGALSNAAGQVIVEWTCEDEATVVAWTERGGPPVKPPTRKGFGSRLIGSLAREIGGEVTLDHAPAGVRCRIRFAPTQRAPDRRVLNPMATSQPRGVVT